VFGGVSCVTFRDTPPAPHFGSCFSHGAAPFGLFGGSNAGKGTRVCGAIPFASLNGPGMPATNPRPCVRGLETAVPSPSPKMGAMGIATTGMPGPCDQRASMATRWWSGAGSAEARALGNAKSQIHSTVTSCCAALDAPLFGNPQPPTSRSVRQSTARSRFRCRNAATSRMSRTTSRQSWRYGTANATSQVDCLPIQYTARGP
jgi:hypothetical protein